MVEPFVLAVDKQNRKISLSLEQQGKEEVPLPEVGEIVEGAVDRVMPYGIFLKLDNGVSGLIPNSEMGTPRGTNHNKMFPAGTRMQVVVIGVDKQTKKISFSRNAVSEKVEKDDFSRYRTQGEQKSGADLGSFGELLQKHLQGNRERLAVSQAGPRRFDRDRFGARGAFSLSTARARTGFAGKR